MWWIVLKEKNDKTWLVPLGAGEGNKCGLSLRREDEWGSEAMLVALLMVLKTTNSLGREGAV